MLRQSRRYGVKYSGPPYWRAGPASSGAHVTLSCPWLLCPRVRSGSMQAFSVRLAIRTRLEARGSRAGHAVAGLAHVGHAPKRLEGTRMRHLAPAGKAGLTDASGWSSGARRQAARRRPSCLRAECGG
jgi:hypothetical protein